MAHKSVTQFALGMVGLALMVQVGLAQANGSYFARTVSVAEGSTADVWVWVPAGVANVRAEGSGYGDLDAWLYTASGKLIASDTDYTSFCVLDGTSYLNYERWYRVRLKAYNGDIDVVVTAWSE